MFYEQYSVIDCDGHIVEKMEFSGIWFGVLVI
jgi:hypothetical protein